MLTEATLKRLGTAHTVVTPRPPCAKGREARLPPMFRMRW